MSEFEPINEVVIVKVGTSTLADTHEDGRQELNLNAFRVLGQQILQLREHGVHPIIVTSAAITAGMAEVGMKKKTRRKERNA